MNILKSAGDYCCCCCCREGEFYAHYVPSEGSGGGRDARNYKVVWESKAERVSRCCATWIGFSHRSPSERAVGAALHRNRWEVVCGSKLHSGQVSVVESPMACLNVSSLEHGPDRSWVRVVR